VMLKLHFELFVKCHGSPQELKKSIEKVSKKNQLIAP